MAKSGTLAYFKKDAPSKVIADASPVGLGALLVQSQDGAWVPICYAGCSLTECECKYSPRPKRRHLLLFGHVRDSMPTSVDEV